MNWFSEEDGKLIWQKNHELLQIEPWENDSLRIRSTYPRIEERRWACLIRLKSPLKSKSPKTARPSKTAKSRLKSLPPVPSLTLKALTIPFFLEETYIRTADIPIPPAFKPLGSDLFHLEASFKAYAGERLYGLGQHQHGFLDQKGCVVGLYQKNTEVSIPFMLSSAATASSGTIPPSVRTELGLNRTKWTAEASRCLDYVIIAGDSPAEIMGRYADITGHAPQMPEWAQGFWQCKLRYKTQDELLSVAREYKKRGLPLSIIVTDFFHWTLQGDWKFDPACWPDPDAMVRELDQMGFKLMVSIWPTVNENSENFQAMKENGLLVRNREGGLASRPFFDNKPAGPIITYFYDPTNPAAKKFVWGKVRDNYYKKGIKVWWLDACEPELAEENEPGSLLYHPRQRSGSRQPLSPFQSADILRRDAGRKRNRICHALPLRLGRQSAFRRRPSGPAISFPPLKPSRRRSVPVSTSA